MLLPNKQLNFIFIKPIHFHTRLAPWDQPLKLLVLPLNLFYSTGVSNAVYTPVLEFSQYVNISPSFEIVHARSLLSETCKIKTSQIELKNVRGLKGLPRFPEGAAKVLKLTLFVKS